MSKDTLAFIPTKSSMLNKKLEENFKAVTYHSYKKKAVKGTKSAVKKKENNLQTENFNIKQAKHEIVKFGMSGFDTQKKEEAKVQLAIRLGAKPPKNKYKNYKQLLTERKKDKEVAKSRLDFQQLGKNQIGKSIAKGKGFDRKRRKQKSDLLDDYGKVKRTTKSIST